MRAVVAKRLRRKAEGQTFGRPARKLVQHDISGVVMNAPHTTRAAYRALKKEYASGGAR